MSETKMQVVSPFAVGKTYEGKKDFDKYYYDIQDKDVYKSTGQKDENGDELGIIEKKFIVKKIDIQESLNAQADSVGVEAYMRALALQGNDIAEFHTEVDAERVQDFSQMPDTLAEVMLAGDRAKRAFMEMDPALRGSHTTIEGFLNSLSQEAIDNYILGRVEALTPKKEVVETKKEGE